MAGQEEVAWASPLNCQVRDILQPLKRAPFVVPLVASRSIGSSIPLAFKINNDCIPG